jgi:hypothetical protein
MCPSRKPCRAPVFNGWSNEPPRGTEIPPGTGLAFPGLGFPTRQAPSQVPLSSSLRDVEKSTPLKDLSFGQPDRGQHAVCDGVNPNGSVVDPRRWPTLCVQISVAPVAIDHDFLALVPVKELIRTP